MTKDRLAALKAVWLLNICVIPMINWLLVCFSRNKSSPKVTLERIWSVVVLFTFLFTCYGYQMTNIKAIVLY